MKVRVKRADHQVDLEFDVPTGTTLGQFREMIRQRTNIPFNLQRIIFHGRPLSNDFVALEQFGIQDGFAVHLVETADRPPVLPGTTQGPDSGSEESTSSAIGVAPANRVDRVHFYNNNSIRYTVPVVFGRGDSDLQTFKLIVERTIQNTFPDFAERVSIVTRPNTSGNGPFGTVTINMPGQNNPIVDSPAMQRILMIWEHLSHIEAFLTVTQDELIAIVEDVLNGSPQLSGDEEATQRQILVKWAEQIERVAAQLTSANCPWVPDPARSEPGRIEQVEPQDQNLQSTSSTEQVPTQADSFLQSRGPTRFRIRHGLPADFTTIATSITRLNNLLAPHFQRMSRVFLHSQVFDIRPSERRLSDSRANVLAVYLELLQGTIHHNSHALHLISDLNLRLEQPVPRGLFPQYSQFRVERPMEGTLVFEMYLDNAENTRNANVIAASDALTIPYEGRPTRTDSSALPFGEQSFVFRSPSPGMMVPMGVQMSRPQVVLAGTTNIPTGSQPSNVPTGTSHTNNSSSTQGPVGSTPQVFQPNQPNSTGGLGHLLNTFVHDVMSGSLASVARSTGPLNLTPNRPVNIGRRVVSLGPRLSPVSNPSNQPPGNTPGVGSTHATQQGNQIRIAPNQPLFLHQRHQHLLTGQPEHQHLHHHILHHHHHPMQHHHHPHHHPIPVAMTSQQLQAQESTGRESPELEQFLMRGLQIRSSPTNTGSPVVTEGTNSPAGGSNQRSNASREAMLNELEETLAARDSNDATDPYLPCSSRHAVGARRPRHFDRVIQSVEQSPSPPFNPTTDIGRMAANMQLRRTENSRVWAMNDAELESLVQLTLRSLQGFMHETDRERHGPSGSSMVQVVAIAAPVPQTQISITAEITPRLPVEPTAPQQRAQINVDTLPQETRNVLERLFRNTTNRSNEPVGRTLPRMDTGQNTVANGLFGIINSIVAELFGMIDIIQLLNGQLDSIANHRNAIRRLIITHYLLDNSRPSIEDLTAAAARMSVSADSARDLVQSGGGELTVQAFGSTWDVPDTAVRIEQIAIRELLCILFDTNMTDANFATSVRRIILHYFHQMMALGNVATDSGPFGYENLIQQHLVRDSQEMLGDQNPESVNFIREQALTQLRRLAQETRRTLGAEDLRGVLVSHLLGSAPKRMRREEPTEGQASTAETSSNAQTSGTATISTDVELLPFNEFPHRTREHLATDTTWRSKVPRSWLTVIGDDIRRMLRRPVYAPPSDAWQRMFERPILRIPAEEVIEEAFENGMQTVHTAAIGRPPTPEDYVEMEDCDKEEIVEMMKDLASKRKDRRDFDSKK